MKGSNHLLVPIELTAGGLCVSVEPMPRKLRRGAVASENATRGQSDRGTSTPGRLDRGQWQLAPLHAGQPLVRRDRAARRPRAKGKQVTGEPIYGLTPIRATLS